MSSKGAKYIVLPVYVVYIGLLYALLLTSGLVLSWVTLYRHEESIAKLKQMLQEKHKSQDPSPLPVTTVTVTEGKKQPNFPEEEGYDVAELGQRPRRHLRHSDAKAGKKLCPKGRKGEKGQKGDKGDRGEAGRDGRDGRDGTIGNPGVQGLQGLMGNPGRKGDAGNKGEEGEPGQMGVPGIKGSKGDKGSDIEVTKSSQVAHIAATGGRVKSYSSKTMIFPRVIWRQKVGNMKYNNGYLEVAVEGIYFIYSQMFYSDGTVPYIGHLMYIDNKEVLKAVHSVVNTTGRHQTQYLGGIFKIKKGQKISVGTPFAKFYYFHESVSFFGAYILHY